MSRATDDVLAERARQVLAEGWSPEHDDTHVNGELALAGAAYAIHSSAVLVPPPEEDKPSLRYSLMAHASGAWPWQFGMKPKSPRFNLIRAAALIIAEIERIDRASASQAEEIKK